MIHEMIAVHPHGLPFMDEKELELLRRVADAASAETDAEEAIRRAQAPDQEAERIRLLGVFYVARIDAATVQLLAAASARRAAVATLRARTTDEAKVEQARVEFERTKREAK